MIKKNGIIFLAYGLLLLLTSIFFAQFISYPENGFKADQSKWPLEAKIIQEKILAEEFSESTKFHMKQLSKALIDHNKNSLRDHFIKANRHGWYWFLIFPLAFIFLYHRFYAKDSIKNYLLVFAPSVLFLMASMFLNVHTLL